MPTKLLVKSYEYETGDASVLGEGTYSKVRLCTNREDGKKVAVKIMSIEQLQEDKAETQVRREVSIARILDHPNVVHMYDFIDDGKNLYVVLEYVNGGDVSRKLEQVGRFGEDEARKIFQQLVVGLRYCHINHRIAHRDLKPENMLIDATTGTIKISDFGLANVSKPVENTNASGPAAELMQTVCGTATYSAPEVLKEQGYDGMIADIWSCGVVLFQLLSGELPFNDDNIPVLYNKIERADYRVPRTIGEGPKDLISKLLVADPKTRLTLDQVIRHPWFAVGFNDSELSAGTVAPPPSDAAVAQAVTKVVPVPADPEDGFTLVYQLLSNNLGDFTTKASTIQQNVKRFTYLIRAPLAEAKVLLTAAHQDMTPKCTINNADKSGNPNDIKGFRPMGKGLVTFVGTLVPTVCPTITLVVVKLGRGDPVDFQSHCVAVNQALGDRASGFSARPAE